MTPEHKEIMDYVPEIIWNKAKSILSIYTFSFNYDGVLPGFSIESNGKLWYHDSRFHKVSISKEELKKLYKIHVLHAAFK